MWRFIAYTSFFSPVIVLVASRFSKNSSRSLDLVYLVLAIGLLFDVTGLFFANNGLNTYPLGNAFLIFQGALFLLLYIKKLRISRYQIAVLVGYLLVSGIDFFVISGPFVLNSISQTMCAFTMTVASLVYLRMITNEKIDSTVYLSPMTWINFGVLIYYSGNLFLFMLNNYFSTDASGYHKSAWSIHNLLNVIKNIFFLIAIWQNSRRIP